MIKQPALWAFQALEEFVEGYTLWLDRFKKSMEKKEIDNCKTAWCLFMNKDLLVLLCFSKLYLYRKKRSICTLKFLKISPPNLTQIKKKIIYTLIWCTNASDKVRFYQYFGFVFLVFLRFCSFYCTPERLPLHKVY